MLSSVVLLWMRADDRASAESSLPSTRSLAKRQPEHASVPLILRSTSSEAQVVHVCVVLLDEDVEDLDVSGSGGWPR